MRISLELVPRNKESVLEEVGKITKNLKKVNTINIPDLLRFDCLRYRRTASRRIDRLKHMK